MPELPEVEALVRFLRQQTVGRRITRLDVSGIWSLRTPLPAHPDGVVVDVTRHGKWIDLVTDGSPAHLLIHLAKAGWLRWYPAVPARTPALGRSPITLRLGLDDGSGFDLTEAGTRKRLAVWAAASPQIVPQIASLGPDPLAEDFTVDRLAAVLRAQNRQVKGALRDQSLIAGVGNAYSDEILHAARLSPFALTGSLDDAAVARLHAAMVAVLRSAIAAADGRPAAELKDAKRRTLRVHGRAGQPCEGWDGTPCGDTVHEVSFADSSLQYCPTCQTGGTPLADRRLSRLLR